MAPPTPEDEYIDNLYKNHSTETLLSRYPDYFQTSQNVEQELAWHAVSREEKTRIKQALKDYFNAGKHWDDPTNVDVDHMPGYMLERGRKYLGTLDKTPLYHLKMNRETGEETEEVYDYMYKFDSGDSNFNKTDGSNKGGMEGGKMNLFNHMRTGDPAHDISQDSVWDSIGTAWWDDLRSGKWWKKMALMPLSLPTAIMDGALSAAGGGNFIATSGNVMENYTWEQAAIDIAVMVAMSAASVVGPGAVIAARASLRKAVGKLATKVGATAAQEKQMLAAGMKRLTGGGRSVHNPELKVPLLTEEEQLANFQDLVDNVHSNEKSWAEQEARTGTQGQEAATVDTSSNVQPGVLRKSTATNTKGRSAAILDVEDKDPFHISAEAYIKPDDRMKQMGDWVYDRALSDTETAVYVNKVDKHVMVANRGSKTAYDWLVSDAQIATGTEGRLPSGFDRFNKAVDDMQRVADVYAKQGYTIDSTGHSLGGGASIYVTKKLGNQPWFGHTWTFNGAATPLSNAAYFLDGAGETLGSKVTNIRQITDAVSFSRQPFGTMKTYAGTFNPVEAHSMGSFGAGEKVTAPLEWLQEHPKVADELIAAGKVVKTPAGYAFKKEVTGGGGNSQPEIHTYKDATGWHWYMGPNKPDPARPKCPGGGYAPNGNVGLCEIDPFRRHRRPVPAAVLGGGSFADPGSNDAVGPGPPILGITPTGITPTGPVRCAVRPRIPYM